MLQHCQIHRQLKTPLNHFLSVFLLITCWLAYTSTAMAHGISEESKKTMADGSFADYIWLGAEHMVTGYDHLLFLFGVIFFLTGFKDIVKFITAFTLGHCITLLGATLAGISANAHLIDAVIALSVIYKGFENLDGFKKQFGIKAPNLLLMVFIFGLIHGFGLSTRLQELTLGNEGMVSRILAFNVGVELGQIAALSAMLALFALLRKSTRFETLGTAANAGLIIAGLGLFVFQMAGYAHGDEEHNDHHTEHVEDHHDNEGLHSHGDQEHTHGDEEHNHDNDSHSHKEGATKKSEQENKSNGVTETPIKAGTTGTPEKASATPSTQEKSDHSQKDHSHSHGKGHTHKKKKHRHKKGKVHSHGKGKPHQH